MRHDYVNFLAGHTVSSTFNYPYLLPSTFYLLPFNGLIAFLSAIGEYNFLTVTSSLYPRFLPSYTRDRFTVCEHELLVPEENFLYSFFTGEFS